MEQELNLEEIETLAEEKFKGNSTVLDKWLDDSSFTEQCKLILSSPDVKVNSALFAILVLTQHVDRFYCYWEPPLRLELSNFVQELGSTKENLLIEYPPLLSLYAKLAGSVIAEGWSNDPRFQDSLFEINSKICLNILEEVSESMRRLHITSDKGVPIALIIDYSFKSISFPDGDSEISNAALKSILSALNYYSLGFDQKIDDQPKSIIKIDSETQKILTDSNFIEQIFLLSQVEANLCFQILLVIISCDFDVNTETKKNIYTYFIDQVCNACALELDAAATNQFFRLILQLKTKIDHLLRLYQYDFEKFLSTVNEKMKAILSNTSSFEENNSAIGTIFSFIETLKEERYSDTVLGAGLFDYMRIGSIESFTRSALTLLSFENSSDAEVFDLDKTNHFHPWFMTINKIIIDPAPETLTVLFGIFDAEKSLNPEQLSFICVLIMSIIYKTSNIPESYYEKYGEVYSESVRRLLSVFHDCLSSPYLINAFLLFLRQYENFPFLCQPSSFSTYFYSKLKEKINISSISEMLQFLFEILISIFQGSENGYYLFDSCKALEYMFRSNSLFHSFIMPLPAVKSIVELRIEHPFPFLLNSRFTRVRTEFHRSLATILVNKDATEFLNLYLSIYDNALTEPTQSTAPITGQIEESVWSYLCDFTGFFKFAVQKSDFLIFYSYILSHNHFQSLLEHANNITTFSQDMLIQFLKFWSVLLNNNPSKIQFRHHSKDGLNLFHFALDTLQSIIKAAVPNMLPGADITRKTICHIFRIINSLLVADYVPYKCFDYYGDTGLVDLLVIVNTCLEAAPPQELKDYPKLEKELMNLISSICSFHIEATAKPEVACTEIILDIINYGLCSNEATIRDKALNCLSSFISFRGEFVKLDDPSNPDAAPNLEDDFNAGFLAVIPNEKLILSTCNLWNMLLASPKYNVIECIKEIFERFPDLAEFVHSKMQGFLIQNEELVELFESSYTKFYDDCSKMFTSGDTSMFQPAIKEFVNNALRCLMAPAKVFSTV